MLRIDNFIPETEEEAGVEPVSFTFEKGLTSLEPEQKRLFDIASFSFSGIKEGSLEIDDLKVDSTLRPLSRVLLYRIGIKDFVALSAIFVMPSKIKDVVNKRKEISKGLKDLKNKTSESLDEKKEKFASLLDFLDAQGVSYILIDDNNLINGEHHDDIEPILSSKECTSIVLKRSPAAVKEKPQEEDGANPKSELKKYLSKESFNFAFTGIFSLLSGFTIFATVCLLGTGGVGLGVALLILAILDSIMLIFVYTSTEDSSKRREVSKQTYTKIRILLIVTYLLGYIIGVGAAAIFGINNILYSLGDYWGLGLGLAIGFGILFLLGAIFPNISSKIVSKIKGLFAKKK